MADQLQLRGGDTASNSTFTGAQRELSVDTSKNQLIVHDGVTPGGYPIPTTDDPVFTGAAEFGGSASFAGNVTLDGSLFAKGNTAELYVGPNNGTSAENEWGALVKSFGYLALFKKDTQTDGDAFITCNRYGEPTCFQVNANGDLTANGSASFAGDEFQVFSTGEVNQSGRTLYKVGPAVDNSAVIVSHASAASRYGTWYGDGSLVIGGTITGNGAATDDANITLNADGSASFASGNLNIYSNGDLVLGATGNTTGNFGYIALSDKISMQGSDGSATFAGDVTTSAVISSRTDAAQGCFHTQLNGEFTSITFSNGEHRMFDSVNINDNTKDKYRLDASGTMRTRGEVNIYASNGSFADSAAIQLKPDGSATFQGTVTATVVPPSDARFKENITPANPQLADVVALGGLLKNYDWNEDAPVNDELRATRQLGLIAQEVEVVCPGIVKDLGSEEDRYKGISTDVLIMKLIGAVTELKAEIEVLKKA